ncbi:ribonuclease P protein component [Solimicrobium silvestre]|uniref:Ribonuclease P protein component n=1 Tax=Solimicrobium silvestre TaxID=2099400 RepID=A0A2S9H262_9BURK|nr:ribonuclease P protein component [Solimicrobium silvestre]PRC94033.1 rnpA: ribonuclease P protein component [Solimicrobium silvestre]
MTGNFERTRRIVKTDEFSSVFRLRPVFKTDHLVLYARPNSLSHARLGVVAAKRLAPRAVTRNAVKRAVREGFRQSELLSSLGLDCVVRLSKSVGSKKEPACTAAIQALLHAEVLSLFAIPSKLNRVLEAAAAAALVIAKPPATDASAE